ncbi:MAG TPA: hypothetical protein VLE69_00830 [Candidatus Saccharimonadales bacterium]|nr:hypothetical protein [Candidatus Saccharimonadales bacterium]
MNPKDLIPVFKHENHAEHLPIIARRENVLYGAGGFALEIERVLGLSEEVITYAAKPENLSAAFPDLEKALNDEYNKSEETLVSDEYVPASQQIIDNADSQGNLDIGQAKDAVLRALNEEQTYDSETV